jgi:hypothetical protein
MYNTLGPDGIELGAIKHEERLVRITLEVLAIEDHTVAIRTAYANITGEKPRLTFTGFRSVFHTFPIYLAYQNLYKLNEHTTCTPRRILTRPSQTIAAQCYSDCLADAKHEAVDRPVGMIFPYEGIKGGLIMHNGRFASPQERRGCRLQWNDGGKARFLERYFAVLDWLQGCQWESGMSPPCNENDNIPTLPQFMQAIKDHAALRVMLFFVHLSRGPSVPLTELEAVHASVVRLESRRWLAIDQTHLAAATGLKVDRVKHGIKLLQSKGCLTVRKAGRGNLYRISNDVVEILLPMEDDYDFST